MKYYRSISGGLAFIITAVLICSCNKNIPDDSSQPVQTTPAQTTVQTQQPENDEKALFDGCDIESSDLPDGLDYIQTLQYINGSVYFSGCVQSNKTENSECILDLKTGDVIRTKCVLDSTYVDQVLLTDDKTIYIYSDDEYNTIAAAADTKTGEIKARIKLDEDIIVKKMIYDETTSQIMMLTVSDIFDNEKSALMIYDTDLKPVTQVQLGEKLKFESHEKAEKIIKIKDGYFILTSVYDEKLMLSSQFQPEENLVVYKLYATDKDMNIKYETENSFGSIADIFTVKNGNVIIVPGKNTDTKINISELDYRSGMVQNEYELSDISVIYPPCGNYDLLFEKNSDDILYGLTLESGEPQKIASYGTDIDSIYSQCLISSSFSDMILFNTQVSDDVSPYMFKADQKGNILGQTAVSETDSDFYAQQTYVSQKGDIYCLSSKITEPVPDETTTEETTESDDTHLIEYCVSVYSEDGMLKFTRSLGEAADITQSVTVQSIMADDDYIYALMNYETEEESGWRIFVTDQKTQSTSSTIIPDGYYRPQIFMLSDKKIALSYYTSDKQVVAKLDHGKIGRELYTSKICEDEEPVMLDGAGRFSFFYQTGTVLYGIDSKTSENIKLIDLSDKSLGIDIQLVYPMSDDTLMCAAYDYDDCVSEKLFFLKTQADQKVTVNEMIP